MSHVSQNIQDAKFVKYNIDYDFWTMDDTQRIYLRAQGPVIC